jgi:hypothetical protein
LETESEGGENVYCDIVIMMLQIHSVAHCRCGEAVELTALQLSTQNSNLYYSLTRRRVGGRANLCSVLESRCFKNFRNPWTLAFNI